MVDAAGQELSCTQGGESASSTGAFPNAPIKNKVLFGAGDTFRISSGIYADKSCPLSRDLTGKWIAKVAVKIMVVEGPLVKDIRYVKAVGEVEVEFLKPEGEDLAYIKAVQDWLSKADPKEINGYTEKVKPLTWGELLSSFRIPVNRILLPKYPTSTYAGYELYDHFPTLANAKLDVIENQEKALQNWCDRGQSQEKILKRKQETLAELDSYANQVKIFLGCHPNFLYGNSLRKRLAVCLGLNGRVAEAMEQVELLSKGEGKEAEDAREFLGCIEGKKKIEAAPVEKSAPEK